MYHYPSRVKSGYDLEVTGPWLDYDFFTQNFSSNMSSVDHHNSIMKSAMTQTWSQLPVSQVMRELAG